MVVFTPEAHDSNVEPCCVRDYAEEVLSLHSKLKGQGFRVIRGSPASLGIAKHEILYPPVFYGFKNLLGKRHGGVPLFV